MLLRRRRFHIGIITILFLISKTTIIGGLLMPKRQGSAPPPEAHTLPLFPINLSRSGRRNRVHNPKARPYLWGYIKTAWRKRLMSRWNGKKWRRPSSSSVGYAGWNEMGVSQRDTNRSGGSDEALKNGGVRHGGVCFTFTAFVHCLVSEAVAWRRGFALIASLTCVSYSSILTYIFRPKNKILHIFQYSWHRSKLHFGSKFIESVLFWSLNFSIYFTIGQEYEFILFMLLFLA